MIPEFGRWRQEDRELTITLLQSGLEALTEKQMIAEGLNSRLAVLPVCLGHSPYFRVLSKELARGPT